MNLSMCGILLLRVILAAIALFSLYRLHTASRLSRERGYGNYGRIGVSSSPTRIGTPPRRTRKSGGSDVH